MPITITIINNIQLFLFNLVYFEIIDQIATSKDLQ